MNRSRFGILIPFSKSVILSNITNLFLATASNSHHSISIALCRASTITYTFVLCRTSICTFVDNCCFDAIMLSSLASFCTIYASIKCCSTTLSSFNSSMNTRSTNVTPSLVYFFTSFIVAQNSTAYVLVVFNYVLNYRLCKLYFLLTRLHLCTFQRPWWMWQWPYSQWLNIQHTFFLCSFHLLF